MKRNFRLLLQALALSTALPLAAHADVIDFESGDLTGLYFPGNTFSQGDYTLTTLNNFGTIDTAAGLGAQAPTGDDTQFYFNSNDGSLQLARTDGAAFNLLSFSAAFVPLSPASTQSTVLFALGTKADNSTVSGYWFFTQNPSGQYTFADNTGGAFSGLTKIEFHACSLVAGQVCTEATMNNGQFALDNIAVSAVSAVPEGSTTALMALGLMGLGFAARRARCGQA